MLFLKPNTALCQLSNPLDIPKKWGRVDHEVEIAVLLGSNLTNASPGQVKNAVVGFAVALDLTLRDMQQECKERLAVGKNPKVLIILAQSLILFPLKNSLIGTKSVLV